MCLLKLQCFQFSLLCGRTPTWWELADSDLLGEDFHGPGFSKRVGFHMFYLAGSLGAGVIFVGPSAPFLIERGWDEAQLIRECERIGTHMC